MTKPSDLDHNYTEEIRAFYDDRLRKLAHYARQWPLKVAFSVIGKGHATHEKGIRQCHLVCWIETDDPRVHCGQSVSVLAVGPIQYIVKAEIVTHSIQAHIMQCHSEVIEHANQS